MKNLRFEFNGSDSLERNYSQAGQDLFVLAALNGKRNGTYLEVGAGPYAYTNNTFLLETEFNWRGVSVEYNEVYFNDHKSNRKHHIELVDGTKVDYRELLHRGNIQETNIDYLSLDLDNVNTLTALYNIPMDTHKFATITYEHDAYIYGPIYKEASARYLLEKGYELVVSNITPNQSEFPNTGSFEDWWVHPDLVDREIINRMKSIGEGSKEWNAYIYK